MAFNGNESLPEWIARKHFLQRRKEAELKISRRHAKQVAPLELRIPRAPDSPAFLYTTEPPTMAEVADQHPGAAFKGRNALVRYRSYWPEGQIFDTTETEALEHTLTRLTDFMVFSHHFDQMNWHVDSLSELVTNLYLIGGPERRRAVTALTERLMAHADGNEVTMLMPNKRSDLYTGTLMLETLGRMNEQFGGALQPYIDNIQVTESAEDAVEWYAQNPTGRRIIIPDDQVMSGMQSRGMHLRLFNYGIDRGIDPHTMRDGVEMMLMAGRPPDRDHEDLYRAKETDFNVYAYYRTLGISGIRFDDVVTVLSVHCPGDFGFTEPQERLFADAERHFGLGKAQPPVLHQTWTVKPYDTDEHGGFMYPDFQAQWDYVKGMLGARMPIEPKLKSQI